ncbi:MAG: acylphosphatase [Nitrososphaerales archaeon]
MVKSRLHIYISGYVQGVFYRSTAKRVAESLYLTGWVRNLSDGRVEAVIEGEEENLTKFVEWCKRGPIGAEVESVEVVREEYKGEFKDFRIRY